MAVRREFMVMGDDDEALGIHEIANATNALGMHEIVDATNAFQFMKQPTLLMR